MKSIILVAGMFGTHFLSSVTNLLKIELFATRFSFDRAGHKSLTTGVIGIICVILENPTSLSFLLGFVDLFDSGP